jgi:transposase-like protein
LQKWFIAIYLMLSRKKGISSLQLARDIAVTQKTAWYMLHRIRHMVKPKALREKLSGLIQIDETFVGGKNKNRPWHKKVKYSQGRSFKDKTPVLGMLDGNGQILTKVIPNTKAVTLKPIVYQFIEKDSTIVTDEWKAYNGLGNRYNHCIVDHSRSQYVNECGFTTNGIEGAWSHLKRMIIGIYHQVSRKHLQRYCDEFAYRYNTRTASDENRFIAAFRNVHCRIRYKTLTTPNE